MCTFPMPARRVNGQIEFLQRQDGLRQARAATLQIPCGQCMECRLKRAREWSLRCLHEASLYRSNLFVTFTYADDSVVSLDYSHFQGFMKRLRKRFSIFDVSTWSMCPRFFVCGEYGETNPRTGEIDGGLYRPHFHAILFGVDMPDRKACRLIGGADLFTSALLDKLWSHGSCKFGSVTFESANYVAGYCMKKINGDLAKGRYELVDDDGVVIDRVPEFAHMSLKPGIGASWFDRFHTDVYPADLVIARGAEMQPPRYYDKRFALKDSAALDLIKADRESAGLLRSSDHTDSRNAVRDTVIRSRLSQSSRSL